MKITHFFCQLGRISAKYQLLCITFCMVVTIVMGLGLLRVKIVTDPQDLWVNKSMRTNMEQNNFDAKYGKFFRINQIIVKSSGADRDLITKDVLYQLYDLQMAIENASTTFQGISYTVDDFCYKPISNEGCIITSPLDYWKKNKTLIMETDDLQKTLLCFADSTNKLPCSDKNGIPVIQEVVLGGITCEYNIKGALGKQCVPKASALMVTYLLNNDRFTQAAAEHWEKTVYLDTIQQYQQQFNANGLELSYMAERSIPDELEDETSQNVGVVVISYVVMFLYITVAIGSFGSKVHSGCLLGLFGIAVVISSLLCSIGLAGYLGIGLSMISAEVVPFLVLAIGVDNMFILSNAYLRTDSQFNIEQRIGEALSEVGPSITIAAICEFCAFIVGYFTKIPALSQFSFIAAYAVVFDYLFQVLGFLAFMAWNQQRIKDNRMDLLFCIQVKNEEPREPVVSKMVEKYLVPFVFHKVTKVCIMISFLVFIVLGVVGCFQLQLGLEQQVSLIDNSYLYKYFTNQFKYGEAGPPAYVVLEGVDYQDQFQLEQLGNMQDSLSSLTQSVQPPIYDWTQVFQQFINTGGNWAADCGTHNALLLPFQQQLLMFRNIKIESTCCQDYGICGEQFEKDIVFNADGSVASTRLRFQHIPLQTSDQFILAFRQAREVVDYYQNIINQHLASTSPSTPPVKMYSYSLFYIYFEQYSYIRGLAVQNLLVATAVVFLVIMLFKNARTAIFTYLAVFFTAFDVIGLCWIMNLMLPGFPLQINAVSVVNLIIAVGLGVEFCVHIIISFMNSQGTRQERAEQALKVTGSSILIGIVMTKLLGVFVLAFANSTLFKLYYFRMYLAIIIFGTFHGLFFLPVLLSYVGPKGSRNTPGQHKSEINSLLLQDKLFK